MFCIHTFRRSSNMSKKHSCIIHYATFQSSSFSLFLSSLKTNLALLVTDTTTSKVPVASAMISVLFLAATLSYEQEGAKNCSTKCATSTEHQQQTIPQLPQQFQPRVPYPEWDSDWDGRQHYKSDGAKTIRHIILVRHGQYEMDPVDDKLRVLTPLGRRQAELTGQRLALLERCGLGPHTSYSSSRNSTDGIDCHNDCYAKPCCVKSIHVSDMTRAKETAAIIASHLSTATAKLQPPDPLLNERIPAHVIPSRPDVVVNEIEIQKNQEICEKAFHKYMYRSWSTGPESSLQTISTPPKTTKSLAGVVEQQQQEKHEFEIFVCHANVIRYFVCRALQGSKTRVIEQC